MVTAITTTPQILTSSSSAVRRGVWCLCWFVNLLLQDRGYEIFRTLLGKQALRLLAINIRKVVWVLAGISITIYTGSKTAHSKQHSKKEIFHLSPSERQLAKCRIHSPFSQRFRQNIDKIQKPPDTSYIAKEPKPLLKPIYYVLHQ
jgi:hypothetical protein